MKTFLKENIFLVIGVILIVFVLTIAGLLISLASDLNDSTIYTKDNKSYNISENDILIEKSMYLEIKKDDKVIRIPWENISSWE